MKRYLWWWIRQLDIKNHNDIRRSGPRGSVRRTKLQMENDDVYV